MAGILPDFLTNSGLFGNMSAPQQAQPVPQQGGGFLSALGNYLGDNSSMLMGLGAGIAQGGIGKGLQLGAQYGLLDQAQRDKSQQAAVQRANILSTYQSLKAAGIPESQAQAAALNPEILKALTPQVYGKTPEVKIIKDAFGNEVPYAVDAVRGTRKQLTEEGGGEGGGVSGTSPTFLAPGVKTVDSNLTGDEYLKQFSPEVQSAVRNYVEGKSLPTGNPRQGFTQNIKMIASKYGNDIGVPADDSTFTARRQIRNQLSSGGLGSLGGQLNTGNTAIGHLADLSDAALKLGNVGTGVFENIPGSASVAHGINIIGNTKGSNSPNVNAFNDIRERYVQEITKFYSGSPGAQAERDRAIAVFDAAKTPQELASAIKAESELMHSKLSALDSQIRGVLGPAADQYPVIRPESQKALEKIDQNVRKLRGDTVPAVQTAPAAPAIQPQPLAGGWQDLGGGVRIREKR